MASYPYLSWFRHHPLLWSLILLPVLIVATGEMFGWPFLRGPIETLLNRQLERPVRIDAPFRVRFVGRLSAQAAGLWIAAPPEFDVPHFFDAGDIRLKLRYRDLWQLRHSTELRIAVLDVGRMDARLVRNERDATWRFGKSDTGKPKPELPVLDLLAIRQGSLVFQDPALEADLSARFETGESAAGAAPAASTFHLQVGGRFRGRPLNGDLATTGGLPASTQGTGAPPVAAKGWLSFGPVRADFAGEVDDLFGRRDIRGEVAVKGPSLGILGQLAGATLPTTAAFSLQGKIEKKGDVWRVDVGRGRIGNSDLAARFSYDTGVEPPRLEGHLGGSRLVLADLAPAFGTRDVEGATIRRRPGHLFPDRPLDLPSLINMDANITVDLQRVDLGSAFREPIQPFKATLTLDKGKLGLAKIDARTAKGRLSGDIAVDAGQKTPYWRADLAWEGIRLEEWLHSGRKRESKSAPAAGEPPYFTGTLQGRAKLAGPGRSTAELLASLDGEITAFVRNGTLSHLIIEVLGLDVAQGLGLVLTGDKTLPVQCAVMDWRATDGVLTPKVALIDTPVTLILADGSVSLAQESLNLRLTAKPKNVSPLTVRSPIRVRGSLDDPEVAPESGPIAARVLGGIALGFINPLAAILPFIDPGGASGSPCAQAMAALKR
jgi:AsmA family protein